MKAKEKLYWKMKAYEIDFGVDPKRALSLYKLAGFSDKEIKAYEERETRKTLFLLGVFGTWFLMNILSI